MKLQVAFDVVKKVATVQLDGTSEPAGSTVVGTFVRPDTVELGTSPNFVIFHQVQELLYHQGIHDMGAVTITIDEATQPYLDAANTVEEIDGEPAMQTVAVTALHIKYPDPQVMLNVGETKQLVVDVEPDTITDYQLMFESSDPAVANVDGAGTVVGISEGTATVGVGVKDHLDVQATIEVVVS